MRRSRKIKHGAKYHVIARANRREMILESRELKSMFLDVVKRERQEGDGMVEGWKDGKMEGWFCSTFQYSTRDGS